MTKPSPVPLEAPRRAAYAVRRLALSRFRTYATASIAVDARPVALFGDNGAGKTNLLEAVSLLSPGRGLRGAPLVDSARRAPGSTAPEGPWAVAAAVEGPEGVFEIGTGLAETAPGAPLIERRVVRLNGAPATSAAALSETFRVLWLTPAMDRLFVEAASGRRKFLDRLTLAFEPAHARRSAAYERAMRDRLRLLKEGGADPHWLDALEAQMAAEGLAVAAARARTVERLKADLAPPSHAFPAAAIAISGRFEENRAPGDSGEARFRDELARRRGADAEQGRTSFGPHTADLEVAHAGTGRAAAECSTGEQKALLIGLVLAAARAQGREDAAPALLLDEIAAHLDPGRRAALFDDICAMGAQAWMTGADASLFAGLGDRAQGFRVAAATLHPSSL